MSMNAGPGSALRLVERALENLGRKRGKSRGAWQCPAPGHADRHPSFQARQNDRGVELRCFVGCSQHEMLRGLGLCEDDLLDETTADESVSDAEPRVVAYYDYVDRQAEPLARKVRYEPKSFMWEVPDGRGGWRKARSGEGNPGVLYNLPELVEADEVHLCEGEKAADRLMQADHVATCPPAGWRKEFGEFFRSKLVTIWQDRDEAGRRKAQDAYRDLQSVAKSVRVVQSKVDTDKADAFDHLEAGYSVEAAEQVLPRPALDLAAVAFTGDRLRALRNRMELYSPLPGVLDVEPSLHVLIADAKCGKTTLSYVLGLAWAQGLPPWDGAPALPGGRVLFVSNEQSARKIDRVMRRVTGSAHLGTIEAWTDLVTIIARDSELGPDGRQILSMAPEGLELLRAGLAQAAEAGAPYRFAILDSLSRLKPAGVEEKDNDGMATWLSRLAELAVEFGVYVWLIHHAGHNTEGSRGNPISAGRGASAIGQVAQVALYLSKVPGQPRQRKLSIQGNEVDDSTLIFNVSEEPEPVYHVNRFVPADLALPDNWEEIFELGVPLSTNAIAQKMGVAPSSPPNEPPSGYQRRLAQRLCEKLEKLGEIKRLENGCWERRP